MPGQKIAGRRKNVTRLEGKSTLLYSHFPNHAILINELRGASRAGAPKIAGRGLVAAPKSLELDQSGELDH